MFVELLGLAQATNRGVTRSYHLLFRVFSVVDVELEVRGGGGVCHEYLKININIHNLHYTAVSSTMPTCVSIL